MPKPRVSPATIGDQQALGHFLGYFDAQGVALHCYHGGRVYHWGQWGTLYGMQKVLGLCRYVDKPTFLQHWAEEPTGAALVPAPEQLLDLTKLTDETVLREFMKRVDCCAAMLTYLDEDDQLFWFARWRDTPGRLWVRSFDHTEMMWEIRPLWEGTDLQPRRLSPATYPELLRSMRPRLNQVTEQTAQAHNWSEELKARHWL